MQVNFKTPATPGTTFGVAVQMVYPGVITNHYLYSALITDGKRGDIQRLERQIDYEWERMQLGPAALVITGYLHFACTSSAIPTQLGFVVSQGGSVEFMLNDIPGTLSTNVRSISTTNTGDADWQAHDLFDSLPCTTASTDGALCYSPSTPFTSGDLWSFKITFKGTALYPARPAGVRFLMETQEAGEASATWKIVPTGCLYGGMDVGGSPMRGLTTAV
jgi:hypothetical protein